MKDIRPRPVRRYPQHVLMIITFVCTSFLTVGSIAEEPPMTREHPIIAFVRDFSGADTAILETVARFAADPPKDPEAIGFYGAGTYPAQTRMFLAAVNLLSNSGKIDSVEDKYTYELLWRWRESDIIDPATLPPAAKALFGPILDEDLDDRDAADATAYRELAWNTYAKATEELEQHIAARGRVLLSIDATDGDTMFFALVSPEIAKRWRDKALSEHDGYRAGVRAPMWDRFWDHLAYAARGILVEDGRQGYPPGTHRRNETIPFVQ